MMLNVFVNGVEIYNILDYFKCTNIKSKCFHPLFLFFKFPDQIDLYINKEICKFETQDDPMEFMKELIY